MEIKFDCSCGQRVAVDSESAGQQFPCPSCGMLLTVPDLLPSTSTPATQTLEGTNELAITSAPISKRKRTRPKSNNPEQDVTQPRAKKKILSLHQAAKNGAFDKITKEMMSVELFLVQDSRGETALHVAARKGTLYQVPAEFLTPETLSVMECYGRTPLHLAAKYNSINQIPAHVLTPQLLEMKTQNPHRSSVLHVAARNNSLADIPKELLTPELMRQRNGYGETPLKAYENNRATPAQLAYLRKLGVQVNEATLMKDEASVLIDEALSGSETVVKTVEHSESSEPVSLTFQQSPNFMVVGITQGSSEWHKWRSGGIGASDAPIIAGENPWKTAAELLEIKCGRGVENRVNESMQRGIELEPEARDAYSLQKGIIVQPACLQSIEYDWLRASVDGLSYNADLVVEIKCGESVYRKTRDYGRVPDYYYGQLQHILAVTGLSSIDFFCYLPGVPALLLPVARDDAYIERMFYAEADFWSRVLAEVGENPSQSTVEEV